MGQKIKLEDKEYDVENLSDTAKVALQYLKFSNIRIQELRNMQVLLACAKSRYIESLKRELLSDKAGLFLEDD